MNEPNLLILAGGVSSRMKRSVELRTDLNAKLRKDAAQMSKAMILIGSANRPFLDYLLLNAREAGYSEVTIVISQRDGVMKEYYGRKDGSNEFHGLRISLAMQTIPLGHSKPLGTADAVVQGLAARKEWKGRKFTVCNGDNLYSKKALRSMLETEYPNAMIDYDRDALGFEASRIAHFSMTQKDGEGFLTNIMEKPTEEEVEEAKRTSGTIRVSMNIFRLDYDTVLPFVTNVPLHPVRNEKELPTAITAMVRQLPKSMYAYPFSERVPDMTSVEDIERVEEYIAQEFKNVQW